MLYKFGENEDVFRRGLVDFDRMSRPDQSKLHLLLLSQFMLGLGDSIATPDRSDTFAKFIDGAVAMSVRTPGGGQWWGKFRGATQMLAPGYAAQLDELATRTDLPDMLEFMPWFVPEDAGRGDSYGPIGHRSWNCPLTSRSM